MNINRTQYTADRRISPSSQPKNTSPDAPWQAFLSDAERDAGRSSADIGFLAFCIDHMTPEHRADAPKVLLTVSGLAWALKDIEAHYAASQRLADLDDCEAVHRQRFERDYPRAAKVRTELAIERGIMDLLRHGPMPRHDLYQQVRSPQVDSVRFADVFAAMRENGTVRQDERGMVALAEGVR